MPDQIQPRSLWSQPTPEDRYRRDPSFRVLVDTLEHQIRAAHYTPTELREAAILAAIHYENTNIRHMRIVVDPNLSPDEWRIEDEKRKR